MISSRAKTVIKSMIISEKTNSFIESGEGVVLKVAKDATKPEIKKAVEYFFGVEVDCVRTLSVKGKARRSVHGMGRRSDWKKAYVKLKPGQTVDFQAPEVQEETK